MNHLCDKAQAIALQRFNQPARSGFFYACTRWAAIVFLLAAIGALLAGCDSAAAVSVAAQEADSRRDVAAQAMCGPGAVVQWLDASTAECIKEAGHAAARP